MPILLIPILLIYPLCWISASALKKRSPSLAAAAIVLFVGVTAGVPVFHATVRTSYLGNREWTQERAFFFGLFADELTKTGDLQKAAKHMQSQEVKERTLVCIRQIVEPFRALGIYCLSAGGLLLTAASLLIKGLRGKKWSPYIFIVFVFAGGILFDIGLYCRQCASGTEETLETFLHTQQAFLMRDLAGVETDLSVPEIIRITQHEAGKAGRGRGGAAPEGA